MATIILPTTPLPKSASPTPLVFGGWQTPSLGGVETWLARLGNRMSVAVEVPPLKPEPDGRLWTSALLQAWFGGLDVYLRWPQPGLSIGSPGAALIDGAVSGGSTLPLRNMTPGYVIRARQALNVTPGSFRFLHFATDDVTVGSDGKASLPIVPMLRNPLVDGQSVNFGAPAIVGRLGGDASSWTHVIARVSGLSFTIMERR